MILKLLRLLASSQGLATAQDLSRAMGVGDGLVKEMMIQAASLGYLELLPPGCGNKQCQTCRDSTGCLLGGSAQVWALTEKGRRLLEDRSRPAQSETGSV